MKNVRLTSVGCTLQYNTKSITFCRSQCRYYIRVLIGTATYFNRSASSRIGGWRKSRSPQDSAWRLFMSQRTFRPHLEHFKHTSTQGHGIDNQDSSRVRNLEAKVAVYLWDPNAQIRSRRASPTKSSINTTPKKKTRSASDSPDASFLTGFSQPRNGSIFELTSALSAASFEASFPCSSV
jgi:hypothetical protein